MSKINEQIKAIAEPGVISVIEWAMLVQENTMRLLQEELSETDRHKLMFIFNLDEREEARKVLLEYGAGKPARIMIHKGSKKEPICFNTTIGGSQKQLSEANEIETIDAEFEDARPANTSQIRGAVSG